MSESGENQGRVRVRHFDPTNKITRKELDKLLSLTLRSSTAYNVKNWRFVVVLDGEQSKKIRTAAWDQQQITEASALIILCADLKAWENEQINYWRSAPQPARAFTVPAIERYEFGLDQAQRDEAMRSCGIAAQTLMLAAQSMGYDSCPIDGFDFETVAELINLPDDHAICMFVAIGKAFGEEDVPKVNPPVDEVVVTERF